MNLDKTNIIKEHNKKYRLEHKDYDKEYYLKNKYKIKERKKKYHEKLKIKVFEHYGKKCELCGQDKENFLTIDHIGGGGNKHRKKIGNEIYSWLKNNNFPKGFRTLCYNCNLTKKIKDKVKDKKGQEYRQNIKKKVLEHYGLKCNYCGNNQIEYLTIDHINGGGIEHRRKCGNSSFGVYLWIIRNNFPEIFQTLCYNCNCSKR